MFVIISFTTMHAIRTKLFYLAFCLHVHSILALLLYIYTCNFIHGLNLKMNAVHPFCFISKTAFFQICHFALVFSSLSLGVFPADRFLLWK